MVRGSLELLQRGPVQPVGYVADDFVVQCGDSARDHDAPPSILNVFPDARSDGTLEVFRQGTQIMNNGRGCDRMRVIPEPEGKSFSDITAEKTFAVRP